MSKLRPVARDQSLELSAEDVLTNLLIVCSTLTRRQARKHKDAREIMSCTGSCQNIGRSCWTAATSNV